MILDQENTLTMYDRKRNVATKCIPGIKDDYLLKMTKVNKSNGFSMPYYLIKQENNVMTFSF